MQVVYKYPIPLMGDVVEIELPSCANILHVATQNNWPCLWALINPHNKTTEFRKFRIAGTGHPIEGNWKYIGTIFQNVLVWHIFEEEQR